MRNAFGFSVTFILCITLSVTAAAQNTINVPADQPTIQAAINAANNGDMVVVAPGTYTENLNFNGKAITVTSSGGSAVTIVDGGGIGPVVTFMSSEGVNSVLNGFTLRNGVPSNAFPLNWGTGAGIAIYYTSPTITNNLITGNHAVCGIGIEIDGGSAVIRGNTIIGNTQAGGSGGCGGGGIEVTGDSTHPVATPLITGNTITNNSLNFGGGIGASYFSSPTIQNNYIAGNSVYNDGGGIYIQGYGSPVVVQNIIVNNSAGAGGSGGGIYVQGPTSLSAVISNNTIVGNTAFDRSSGIFASVFSPIAISNNLVVTAPGQNGIVCSSYPATYPAFSHNDVVSLGSGGQAWSSNCASFAQSNGNFSADPQFVNPANGDYHLQFGSPAIDVGENAVPNPLQQDYDGKPRIVDGNNDCVDTIDIGAYEFQPTFGANFSPASLSFSAQRLNTTSSAQPVTLSNTGTSCVKTAAILVTGSFAQGNTCGIGVPAGAVCTVSVTFTATARGTSTGMLALNNSLPGTAPSVSLAGTGVASIAGLTPASLNFASQGVGTASTAQTITLTNSGDATLNITSISVSGDFQQTNNCGTVVAVNSSCIINITFTPTVAGTRGGTLTVVDDSFGGNQQTAALSGTGTVATIGLAIDAQVSADQGTPKSTVSTVPFSTVAGNELLLAFIATDYTSGTNTTVKSVIGGGLTWVLVVRSNKQSGTSEIWRAFAPSPLSNVSVTATLSHSVVSSMTVVSFAGANSSGFNGAGAIGATKSTNAASGAPTATLVTTQNSSWVFGVGNDFDNAIGRTPGAGQVLVHQDLSPTGDAYWVQRQTAPTLLSGTNVTINDTAPAGDRYNLAICEVLPAQ